MQASKTSAPQPGSARKGAGKSTAAPVPAISSRFGNHNLHMALAAHLRRSGLNLQPKLEVSPADDPLEREADRVAEYVQRGVTSGGAANVTPRPNSYAGATMQRKCKHCEEELARARSATASGGSVKPQGLCDDCEEKLMRSPLGSAEASAGGTVETGLERSIMSSLGGGSSLPASLRDSMKQTFATAGVGDIDFGGVRVHTGAQANELTRGVAARAFTVGRDIFFRAGEYEPGTLAGRKLLAHELTHVVQQGAGKASAAATTVRRKPLGGSLLDRESPFPFRDDELNLAHQAGLRLTTTEYTRKLVLQVVRAPDAAAFAEGRQDYRRNSAAALKSVYNRQFHSDVEQLSYALGVFTEQTGFAPGSDELFVRLGDFASRLKTRDSDLVVHESPTPEERQGLDLLLEVREGQEYAYFLAEVERERQLAEERVRPHSYGANGYDYYIFGPLQDVVSEAAEKVPAVFSLVLDFVPIVGQLKGVIEGIVGKDLITGEELAAWQRGLGILLALIPEAKGIFSAGKAGVRGLARAAVKSGESVAKVWRVAKVASRLSASEVRVAIASARSAAARNVARALGEMEEGVAAASRSLPPLTAAASVGKDLAGAVPKVVRLGAQSHTLTFGLSAGRVGAILCSKCGLLIDKAASMARALDKGHPLLRDLEKLVVAANKADRWVEKALRAGGRRAADAEAELQRLADVLADIERRYPEDLTRALAEGEGPTRVDVAPLGANPESGKVRLTTRSSGTEPAVSGEIGRPLAPLQVPEREARVVVEGAHERIVSAEEELLDQVVDRARGRVADNIDAQRVRGSVARGEEHLSPWCMGNACGLSRQTVAQALRGSGVPATKIFTNQVLFIAGTGRHAFTVVELNGKYILIDTTFAQFLGELGGTIKKSEEILRKSGKIGKLIRRELLEKGRLVLNDEIANVYVKIVSESEQGAYALRDLIKEEASLARNIDYLYNMRP